ncbi:MAG: GyrI-like domain-containing protein [Rhizobiaceae bacterium]|nr:GyrI-like domain-containing protein [Rhizobiaceae bacterium]
MCLMCGDATLDHVFTLTERPAHRLTGRSWSGTFEEAAAGALFPLIEAAKGLSARSSTDWKSPIVGLTWLNRPDGFRYFVGIDTDRPAPDFETLDVPGMRCASLWHGAESGTVVESYGRMMRGLQDAGIDRDQSFCDQREEYPPDFDLSAPPALRLLLPVRGDGA